MPIATELTINNTASATDLAQNIFGQGTVVNSATITGQGVQSGIFTGANATLGNAAPSDSGIILSTGNVADFTNSSGTTNTNTASNTSTGHNGAGYAPLDAITGQSTEDAVVLNINFTPTGDYITMQFTFSSEEYLEYVNGGVNDAFGIWVNGNYIPFTPANNDLVSIDTINSTNASNLYLDNPRSADIYNTEMDGTTVTLSIKAPVITGVPNTMVIALADSGDDAYDSNVLISANSVQTIALAFDDAVEMEPNTQIIVDVLNNDVDSTATGLTITEINGVPIVVGQTVTVPTGESITLNADGTITYAVIDGAGNTDVGFVTVNTVADTALNYIVEGGAGDDVIDASYTGDAQGDRIDNFDHSDGSNNDSVVAGDGNDTIISGLGDDTIVAGTGNDFVNAGSGNDTVFGGTGNDSVYGGSGNDLINGGEGNDTLDGDGGDDSIYGGAGNDILIGDGGSDALYGGSENDGIYATSGNNTADGGSGNDSIYMGSGNDIIFGGRGNDIAFGGAGNDTITGGSGNDSLTGGQGSDQFILGNDFGIDTINGSEDAGDTDTDVLNASTMTANVTLTMSGTDPEAGTLTTGANSATFDNIETVTLGSGDDSVAGSTGNDSVTAGTGADTVNMGAGDDTVDLGAGSPDGDQDVVILQDGFGNDTVNNFDAPTANGDGTFTPIDTLDTTNLRDTGGDPVNTNDVVVSNDGSGNAVLTFPNGETITLTGISPTDANNPFYLHAIGIPMSDGTVSGTAGDDVINDTYTGDPDGDMVDGNDAILAGDTGNDDLIHGDAGNDTITSYNGNNEIYGGTGNDSIYSGYGNDTLYGDAGDDRIAGGSGNDMIYGGAGNDIVFSGSGNDIVDLGTGDDEVILGSGDETAYGGTGQDTFHVHQNEGDDVVIGGEGGEGTIGDWLDIDTNTLGATVIATGDEAGVATYGTSATTFSEIERISTDNGDDTVDLSASTLGMIVRTNDGDDTVIGTQGNDNINAGIGNDTINGGLGDDSINASNGDDSIVLTDNFGNDSIRGGEASETTGDTLDGATLTQGVTLTFTGAEAGTISNGTDTATFSEIEQVNTGSGADTVSAGIGAQSVNTGAGDDTVSFFNGDSINSGAGDDTFTAIDFGDTTTGAITIVGGTGGESSEGDTLNLGKLADLSTLTKISDGINENGNETFHGSVTMDDGTILNYAEIENIICFTPGARIATPRGARDIATLKVGDLVVTRDHGLQPIRWIEQRTVPATDRFAPIRIRPGVVTGQERDLLVSPQHRMLFQGYRAELLFGESEVLVAAKHLIDGKDVTQETGGNVTYIHMMFNEHEVVYAEGAATESFHPGELGLTAISDPAREELFTLFPKLRSNLGGYGQTARRCLKSHESDLLVR